MHAELQVSLAIEKKKLAIGKFVYKNFQSQSDTACLFLASGTPRKEAPLEF